MAPLTCPICSGSLNGLPADAPSMDGHYAFFSCPRCGDFGLTGTSEITLPAMLDGDQRRIAKLSYAVRRRQISEKWPKLTDEQCREIVEKGVLPSPAEQADNLIWWLGTHLPGPGEQVWVDANSHQGIIGSPTPAGVYFVLQSLRDSGLIDGSLSREIGNPGKGGRITLTMAGWQRYEQLRLGGVAGTTAFMAMKFGEDELDRIVESYIRPAIRQTGFKLVVLSDNPKAGLIDDRLRVEIRACRFLIADLSHGNAGAYWEAGYAEGLGKPVIYICEKKIFEDPATKPHFDTNHHLTVSWDTNNLDGFAADLKSTVRATIPEARQEDVPE